MCTHPGSRPHLFTAIVTTGSTLTKSEGFAVARMLDITQNSCSKNLTGSVLTASSLTSDLSLGVARQGDMVTTPYGILIFITASVLTSST